MPSATGSFRRERSDHVAMKEERFVRGEVSRTIPAVLDNEEPLGAMVNFDLDHKAKFDAEMGRV